MTGKKKLIVRSPGRINLIGEHTDYNEGYVLPAAISKYIEVELSKRDDFMVALVSVNEGQSFECSLHAIEQSGIQWPDYVLGVVKELQQRNMPLKGFNLTISGDIPMGAGLSSSAAYENAVVFALNEAFGLGLNKIEMIHISKACENNFVGLQCGIMDMFASMMGKKDQAIQLDCRSLQYEYFPLELGNYGIVLLDTRVKHNLASSEYNTRRKECETGVALVKNKYPFVNSLRDATIQMLNECIEDPVIKKRCVYVVEEIQRVQDACARLKEGNLAEFGKLMYATHKGLSECYEVSCDELDFLVEACKKYTAIAGARMMGGGFGGCVISLMNKETAQDIIN